MTASYQRNGKIVTSQHSKLSIQEVTIELSKSSFVYGYR